MANVVRTAQESRAVTVNCIVVGIAGQSVGIKIKLNALVDDVKERIVEAYPELKSVGRGKLLLFLAKKADGAWLSADDAFKKIERRMVTSEVPDEIGDILNDDHKLFNGEGTIAEALGSTSLPPKYLHFLVKPPLKRWIIHPKESSAVTEYKRIADLLKESKEVKAVVKTLEDVRKREEPRPFVVLESSSGTGKTQMAFNLEAQGDFDVFYLPCTPSEDLREEVYQAFKSRQKAFNECLESDIAFIEGEGSVSDFAEVSNKKRLNVYAFIIAALRGANTFMGDAFFEDVKAVRDKREEEKPMIFFLDEFPRLGKDMAGDDLKARKKLVRSMLNVFRFLRLPLIISATNGTAQNLFTVSGYSRPSSGPVSWCMVIPSLPKFFTAKGSATSVFEWIIQHSRPLFGVLAQKYMDQFPYDDGQDRVEYLTDMIKALTPEFRRLKRTKREIEFEKGQLYLFLGVSYDVDDERSGPSRDTGVGDENQVGMSDDESDVDDSSDDDESKEYSDEEMPEARRGRVVNSSKEVDLIDGHYGRMEEQENFELELGILGLMKNERKWRCRCVFPRLDADILLFLTMMGDYEGDEDAPQDSAYLRQLGLSNHKRSPLDLPFREKLRDVSRLSRGFTWRRNGRTSRTTIQDTNDGMGLGALAAGAVVLASHQGGFHGVKFETFFGRLLYELGVRGFNEPMAIPENAEMESFTIPFLSPPNVAWPDEFVAFWENTRAQFANIKRSRHGNSVAFTAHSGLLTCECKDQKKLTWKALKSVLKAIPSTTKVHLVVVKRLRKEYFTRTSESANGLAYVPLESVTESKVAASAETPASSKTNKLTESASAFLERIKLQHAKFYRISRRAGSSLEEFPELMQARRDPYRDEMSRSAGGNMESVGGAGKTILFIEVGDWKYGKFKSAPVQTGKQ
ncbi:hypothetical protein DVH05_028671 [Phytophthora capsici]|nr:hypothetical protein DVH05_028671 [Phytophthora capsici]